MNESLRIARETALSYPRTPHSRRHGPRGDTETRAYKPWLRDEFTFQCVFCLIRERWRPDGQEEFVVDHITPRSAYTDSVDPSRIHDYDNLCYACCSCNRNRQDAVLPFDFGRESIAQHVEFASDGTFEPLSVEGRFLIRVCHLNRPLLIEFRRRLRSLLEFLATHSTADGEPLLRELLGFPSDLPDLAAKRPPNGNARPAGIAQCFFQQQRQGILPDVY